MAPRQSPLAAVVVIAGLLAAPAARSAAVRLVTRSAGGAAIETAGGRLDLYANPTTSADGRYVVFQSLASNVVPGQVDTNLTQDVFLWDRLTGQRSLVSHRAGALTTAANDFSDGYAVSADGNWVAFQSVATDLVTGQVDGNSSRDLFLWSRATGAIVLVSHAAGAPATAGNFGTEWSNFGLSDDGAHLAFSSNATNLVAGQVDGNSDQDLFVYTRATGAIALMSHAAGAPSTAAANGSFAREISADGSLVVFDSEANNLVAGQVDGSSSTHVFACERVTAACFLVSRTAASAVTTANNRADFATVSADGRFIAFKSLGTNLVAGQVDAGTDEDVFLYDRQAAGPARLVSGVAGSATTAANAASFSCRVSADGRWVVFTSQGTDVVGGQVDANGNTDVFLFDRLAGTAQLVSHAAGAPTTAANARSGIPHPSGDGGRVSFFSDATDLVAGQIDAPGTSDAFVWERASDVHALASHAHGAPPAAGNGEVTGSIQITRDGAFVLYDGDQSDLLPPGADTVGSDDVFAFPLAGGVNLLVSGRDPATPSLTANGFSFIQRGAFSADDRFVAILSDARDLVPGGSGPDFTTQAYLWDRSTDAMTLVSHRSGEPSTGSNGQVVTVRVSGDGRWVAYASQASDLVAGQVDSGSTIDLFLFDRLSGTNRLVSHLPGAPATAAASTSGVGVPSLSHDGRFVAYSSRAALVAGQTGPVNTDQVFVYDRDSDTNALASRSTSAATAGGNGVAVGGLVSADGTWVAYASRATDLVAGQVDTAGNDDVFLFDRLAGTNLLASRTTASPVTAGRGNQPALSPDGRWVAFISSGTSLVTGQVGNGFQDVFLFDRVTATTTLVSHAAGAPLTDAGNSSQQPQLSADGAFVAYYSRAVNLVAGQVDANGPSGDDVFLWSRATGENVLVSHVPSSAVTSGTAVSTATPPSISNSGGQVMFASLATDQVAGQVDTNAGLDDFLYQRATGELELASRAMSSPAQAGNGMSDNEPTLSPSGRFAVFASLASDLVPFDHNANADVFLLVLPSVDVAAPASETILEAGGATTFLVRLSLLPAAAVTVDLTSADPDQCTVTLSGVTLDAANWESGVLVGIQAVADAIDDGDRACTIVTAPAVSADPEYSGSDGADVTVTVADDDTAGVLVAPVAGLATTEAGAQASFTVVLASEPLAAVTVPFAASDPSEGSVPVSQLVFGAADWDQPRTVVVSGEDDVLGDGDVAYAVTVGPAASADPLYQGADPPDPALVNRDDDADLAIGKDDGGALARWGEPLTWTATVTNSGPSAVPAAAVADDVPASLSSVSWTCTASGGSSCAPVGVGDLADSASLLVGGTATYTITGVVGTGTAGPIVNTATVAFGGAGTDTAPANNSATETTAVDDLIFEDGFESADVSAWSASEDDGDSLAVTVAAALVGSRGLAVLIDDANPIYVRDDRPIAERRYRARFYLDPNSIAMAEGTRQKIFQARSPAPTARVVTGVLRRLGGTYTILVKTRLDSGVFVNTGFHPIGDQPAIVELDWQRATAAGANDGALRLHLADAQVAELTGLDNDGFAIEEVRLGAIAAPLPTTAGTLFLDAFESRRVAHIGPALGAAATRREDFESASLAAWEVDDRRGLLAAGAAGALRGEAGLAATLREGETAAIAADLGEANRQRVALLLDAGAVTLPDGAALGFLELDDAEDRALLRLEVAAADSTHHTLELVLRSREAGAAWAEIARLPLAAGRRKIALDWKAASLASGADAELRLWLDGALAFDHRGGGTTAAAELRIGIVTPAAAGAGGVLRLDELVIVNPPRAGATPRRPRRPAG